MNHPVKYFVFWWFIHHHMEWAHPRIVAKDYRLYVTHFLGCVGCGDQLEDWEIVGQLCGEGVYSLCSMAWECYCRRTDKN